MFCGNRYSTILEGHLAAHPLDGRGGFVFAYFLSQTLDGVFEELFDGECKQPPFGHALSLKVGW